MCHSFIELKTLIHVLYPVPFSAHDRGSLDGSAWLSNEFNKSSLRLHILWCGRLMDVLSDGLLVVQSLCPASPPLLVFPCLLVPPVFTIRIDTF